MHAMYSAAPGNAPMASLVKPLTMPSLSPALRVSTDPSPTLPAGPYWIGDRTAAKAAGATAAPVWVADVAPGTYADHHGYEYAIRTALAVVPWKRTAATVKLQRKTLHDARPAGRVVHFWRPFTTPRGASEIRFGHLTIRAY